MALATLCGLTNLECGLGKLNVWSTFSDSYFKSVGTTEL